MRKSPHESLLRYRKRLTRVKKSGFIPKSLSSRKEVLLNVYFTKNSGQKQLLNEIIFKNQSTQEKNKFFASINRQIVHIPS